MVELSKQELWRMFWLPRLLKLWPRVALFVGLLVLVVFTGPGPFGAFFTLLALLGGFGWIVEGVFRLLGDPLDIAIDLEHQIIPFSSKSASPTSSDAPPASPPLPDRN